MGEDPRDEAPGQFVIENLQLKLANSPPRPVGRVSLVGAGPGDPGLITLRGREAIAAADVVLYDRLVDPRLLEHARPDAERLYVGKQPGDRTWRQPQINALLVERARAGQVVCRLKGGDPFVFGRGGEEAVALAEAGVPFEIVPGVTSAIAVPAYAGIPVTYRGVSAGLAIIAGQSGEGANGRQGRGQFSIANSHFSNFHYPDPRSPLAPDTLVFLMGVENLPRIVAGLVAGGRSPGTPIALVRWGTWARQETLVGTLATIVEQVRETGFQAPAVTVVGEVVHLREKIRWFDNRPLFGRRILVTRAREQASELSRSLEALGAEPVEFPLIRLEPLNPPDFGFWISDFGLQTDPQSEIQNPKSKVDWVLFTSTNAVFHFWRLLAASGRDWRVLGGARIGAVGLATARALAEHHLRADFIPDQYEAAQIIAQFPEELEGRRVLLPRAADAPEALPEGLRAAGANVEVLAIYRNVPDGEGAAEIGRQLAAGELDAVTFTSSSTVRNFHRFLPSHNLAGCVVACIGPSTEATARELGYRVSVVAAEHTIPGLVQALVETLRRC